MRRRVGGAHRLLGAQQAIADHLAAGLEPDRAVRARAGHARRLAGLDLRRRLAPGRRACCAASRSGTAPGARAPVAELASATRELTYAAGQGLAGPRLGLPARRLDRRAARARRVRAGLVTAAAFPIALGDECVGVIELYASDAREPNAEVSAMFATVGGQLASYLARRRVRARARRSFDGAEALVVALDADGRVEIANGTACAALGSRRGRAARPRLVRDRRRRARARRRP